MAKNIDEERLVRRVADLEAARERARKWRAANPWSDWLKKYHQLRNQRITRQRARWRITPQPAASPRLPAGGTPGTDRPRSP